MGMKRNPGEWLRRILFDRTVGAGLLACLGYGWLLGTGLTLWTAFGAPLFSEWVSLAVLLPGAACLLAALAKARRGWRLPDMRKGAQAEETVGQAIEYALTRDACAVAHHVKDIARFGDIDHLVATPGGLWVIETKHGRVPNANFPETLRRIAENVEGVRDWAPDTRVTGCLVFATDLRKPPKPTYEYGNETIKTFPNRTALMRELRDEARRTGGSLDLARRVWSLGKFEARDQTSSDATGLPHAGWQR